MSAMRSGSEIRREFLEFFRQRGHTLVPSASLIPTDPTLLLTNAGMVPFKPYFLGEEPPTFRRATSVQKCLRTIDIEIVGTTSRHLTFFEMLGNFSFGDYFKDKAIPWAYEFVTEHMGIDPDVLWYTVYEDDDEAAAIWIDGVGVPPDRVQRGGVEQGTFWQMGVPGPCGPSSEIFVDRGPAFGPGGGPLGSGEPGEHRYIEVWNLVFMQNIQDEPYHVIGDLPSRSIDTGMGLDRAAMVLQGVPTVFDTDLVRPVLATAERVTGVAFGAGDQSDIGLRLLADHGRAITFLIGDGVAPSNEGRGYVLRRLLRRAVRHAWSLGAREHITPALVRSTIEVMGEAYPALTEASDGIIETAEREEARFRRTLEGGHSLLERELQSLQSGQVLAGSAAFKLHDTYGFPVELTEEMAAERGIGVDREGFSAEMEAQRERARAAWKGGPDETAAPVYWQLLERAGPTEFLGYEQLRVAGKILSIVRDGEPVVQAGAGEQVEVFVDRTPFYSESGGQVGDTGLLQSATGNARVDGTRSPIKGLHGHQIEVTAGSLKLGQEVTLAVDADRRERIRRAHTGTHVLHWALRQVLGSHVHQAGSLVEPERFRFDFGHHSPVTDGEMAAIEEAANARVIEDSLVRTFEVTRQEAEELGALAFFGDKYGDRVRVVEAGRFSRELCGGTHVEHTGEIGTLAVVSESSIGSNLRRVEALVGSLGFGYLNGLRSQLGAAAQRLRVRPEAVVEATEALLARNRELERRVDGFEKQAQASMAADLAGEAEAVGGARLVVAACPGLGAEELRALAIAVRQRIGTGLVVLGSEREGKAGVVAAVSKDLVGSGVSAADVAGAAARLLGGGSSRDAELAQAGGPRGDRLGEALQEARTRARTVLGGE
jgi:alanyl-tRNA synthetase